MITIRNDQMVDTNATLDAYNDIYQTEGIRLRDSMYLWCINQLKPVSGRLLVDISCGEGRLVHLACQRGLRACGLDFAFSGLEKAKEESPDAGWGVGDGECLPLADASVDYLTHIGSLEHYNDMESGAKEIARVLKKSGKACILLPNMYGILWNIETVIKTGDISIDNQPLQRYGTRRAWEKLLKDAGLKIDRTAGHYGRDHPLTREDWFWFITHPKQMIRSFIHTLMPLNIANLLIFICSKEDV